MPAAEAIEQEREHKQSRQGEQRQQRTAALADDAPLIAVVRVANRQPLQRVAALGSRDAGTLRLEEVCDDSGGVAVG